MQNKNDQKAFTLIELLVVISIIGLLASIILVSLNSARAKARDARRVADMRQLQTAMELYYNDNGAYPSTSGSTLINSGWSSSGDASWSTFQTLMAPYMSKAPVDPQNNTSCWAGSGGTCFNYNVYAHSYGCEGQWYMIIYMVENKSMTSPGQSSCDGTFFQYGGGASGTANQYGIITIGAKAR